ncbi:MAG: urea ABC transporter permease subunit UrtB [Deltaproteobacteria bacterium]|nr:urea ABC transporter permease subunit UrtB [Deltaproteobacteria bacterium]
MTTVKLTLIARSLALFFWVIGMGVLHASQVAQGANLSEATDALKAKSFRGKAAAVTALARLGDARAIPLLQAMRAGRLYVRKSDNALVIVEKAGNAYKLADAVSGQALGGAQRTEVKKIRVNNRVRQAIKAALSRLELLSPERDRRLAAAHAAIGFRSAEMTTLLSKALSLESDPEVRAAIEFALQANRVKTGTSAERLAAVGMLSNSTDPKVRVILEQVAADANADAKVRTAAEAAIASMEAKQYFLELGLSLFQGISLGSVLLLAAIGLAITFGLMGVINMAHGEMIMIGAYSTFVVQEVFRAYIPPQLFDFYLILAIPVAFIVAGGIGMLLERLVIRRLYSRPLETLLATWGISLILQQVVRSVFGAPNKEVANPSWMTGGLDVGGGVVLTYNRLYIIFFCLFVLGAIAFVIRKSSFGLQVRAVTQNREMASTMGIHTGWVDTLTFGLGSGIAGMAGVALSQIGNVSPNLGQLYIVDSFMVVVFGGVGNLAGTLVGAMTLGIINKFLEPVSGAVLGKVVVLVMIILFIQRRPQGLFALRGRAAGN